MNKFLLIATFLLMWAMPGYSQSTYYFKLTKTIKDDVSDTNVSGGMFLSFSKTMCYESDSDGYAIDGRRLKLDEDNGTTKSYTGSSYFGQALFIFKSDLSVLNVYDKSGEIFVFKKTTPPVKSGTFAATGDYKSKRERIAREAAAAGNTGTSNSGVVVNPVYITIDGSSSSSSSGSSSTTTTTPPKQVRTCHWCNGTGKVLHENFTQVGLERRWVTCTECGLRYDANGRTHYHSTCSHCHGMGFLQ